jgi:hypothetical protein
MIRKAALEAEPGEGIGRHIFRHSYSSMLRLLKVDAKMQQGRFERGLSLQSE